MAVRLPRTDQRPLLPLAPRGLFVAVEGPIGVGKTTLARRLAAEMGASALLEVVEENPFLLTFYHDMRGRAFQTQLFFLLSRYRQQQAAGGRLASGEGVISDYMFAKDRLFARLTLDADELALYENVYRLIAPQVPAPDVVVHLRAAVETLLHRIELRGRAFEQEITPGYLASVSSAYDDFFSDFEHAPVVAVDTDRIDLLAEAGLGAVVSAIDAARSAAVSDEPGPGPAAGRGEGWS